MKKVNKERIQIDPNVWFHYWHAHDRDYQGGEYADPSAHLLELGSVFAYLQDKAREIPGDYQIWISLDPADPLQDAVYVHTPNPHSDFPHDMSDVEWSDDVPAQYTSLAHGRRFGRRAYEGHETYVIMDSCNCVEATATE